MARARADDHDLQVVQVAQERRGTDKGIEILRVPHVAGVHDDELRVETNVACPGVRLIEGPEPLRVDPVGDHAQPLRAGALFLQPAAHRVADRHDAVGTAEVEADEPAQKAHQQGILQPLQLHGDLGEDVLADDDQRRPEAARGEEGNVGDDRWIGHAQDDVRTWSSDAAEQSCREVARVVGPAREQLRTL